MEDERAAREKVSLALSAYDQTLLRSTQQIWIPKPLRVRERAAATTVANAAQHIFGAPAELFSSYASGEGSPRPAHMPHEQRPSTSPRFAEVSRSGLYGAVPFPPLNERVRSPRAGGAAGSLPSSPRRLAASAAKRAPSRPVSAAVPTKLSYEMADLFGKSEAFGAADGEADALKAFGESNAEELRQVDANKHHTRGVTQRFHFHRGATEWLQASGALASADGDGAAAGGADGSITAAAPSASAAALVSGVTAAQKRLVDSMGPLGEVVSTSTALKARRAALRSEQRKASAVVQVIRSVHLESAWVPVPVL